jgi:hypothetical protein
MSPKSIAATALAVALGMGLYLNFGVYLFGDNAAVPTHDVKGTVGHIGNDLPVARAQPNTVYVCQDGSTTTVPNGCASVQPQVVVQNPQVAINPPVAAPQPQQQLSTQQASSQVVPHGPVPVSTGDCVHFDARSTRVNGPSTVVNPQTGDEDRHVLMTGPGTYEGIYQATIYFGAGSQCH